MFEKKCVDIISFLLVIVVGDFVLNVSVNLRRRIAHWVFIRKFCILFIYCNYNCNLFGFP